MTTPEQIILNLKLTEMTAQELFDLILKMEKERDINESHTEFSLNNISPEVLQETQKMLISIGSPIQIIVPTKDSKIKVYLTYDQ